MRLAACLAMPSLALGLRARQFSDFLDALGIADVEHVVAADERLADVAFALAIDPLFSVEQLQVHVAVEGDQSALVLHAPLQLHDHRFVNQVD
mmetsp:Transcript_8361/g.11562  ORF Transcript_8361/g.11562 Transcript_8361/m.11562 type:complete len:93 (-) Transcript_8361:159-437(-)|eukprot:CAMPEP_0185568572 /NCGR_PEP_ID=MMETSP0434-20130131/1492_1 /TAXON_ID=626734 ORGANISM="Favella taraikaensis, Strain Fe Narragansett Bay" /NCGR_SAMPLE_ID=MMETSP0434 /ASSEMBLY_ACC=CAM_ASM_000379 /LENGTH=92 /DNA_ID=CAMNT_0028183133 /DNA_START=119 /DNA_END=397 /DNA_ORIENTATION=+